MKLFRDVNGKEWSLAINVGSLKRVRDLAGFDLLSIVENKEAIARITTDLMLLGSVLYALCKPEADAVGLTEETFAAVFNGDVLESASNALLTELVDFFPKARRGPLNAAVKKYQAIQEKAAQMQIQRIEDPALERDLLRKIEEMLDPSPLPKPGDSSTSLPASPESARTP